MWLKHAADCVCHPTTDTVQPVEYCTILALFTQLNSQVMVERLLKVPHTSPILNKDILKVMEMLFLLVTSTKRILALLYVKVFIYVSCSL